MLRSSSVPVPMRVLALFIVVSALVLTTLATALADSHPAAADGQRLEDQSAEVQALYRAVYGDDAEARWIAEHNAAIGMSGDSMMMDDMSMDDPTSNMYYNRIVAVAMARGADAGLANRIAVDVIGRGTEMAFLNGTDAGVLYGIGRSEAEINAAPVSAPAPRSAPAPAPANSGWGITIERVLQKGTSETITLPSVDVDEGKQAVYETTGAALPAGMSLNRLEGEISGTPTTVQKKATTIVRVRVDGALVEDDDGDALEVEVKLTVTSAAVPVFRSLQGNLKLYQNVLVTTDGTAGLVATLPGADLGDGTLEYQLKPDALPFGLTFNTTTRALTVAASDNIVRGHGSAVLTYIAKEPVDGDKVEQTFTVTVEQDQPVKFASGTRSLRVTKVAGRDAVLNLPIVSQAGNGGVTYAADATCSVATSDLTIGAAGSTDDPRVTRDDQLLLGDSYDTTGTNQAVGEFTFCWTATEKQASDVAGNSSATINVTVRIHPADRS